MCVCVGHAYVICVLSIVLLLDTQLGLLARTFLRKARKIYLRKILRKNGTFFFSRVHTSNITIDITIDITGRDN